MTCKYVWEIYTGRCAFYDNNDTLIEEDEYAISASDIGQYCDEVEIAQIDTMRFPDFWTGSYIDDDVDFIWPEKFKNEWIEWEEENE